MVQQRPDKMHEDHHQHPDQLVIPRGRLVREAVNQRDDPKNKQPDDDGENHHHE